MIFVSKFFSISKIFIYGGCRQEGNEEAEDKFGKTDSIWTENPDINTNSFTKCKRPVQHDFLCEQTAFWPSYCPCRFWTLRPTWIIMMMRSMTFSYFGIKKEVKRFQRILHDFFPILDSIWPEQTGNLTEFSHLSVKWTHKNFTLI